MLLLFKPGEAVPHSGLYEAIHRGHRADHPISIAAGALFPDCSVCGAAVRFRFLRNAPPIEFDEDFR